MLTIFSLVIINSLASCHIMLNLLIILLLFMAVFYELWMCGTEVVWDESPSTSFVTLICTNY